MQHWDWVLAAGIIVFIGWALLNFFELIIIDNNKKQLQYIIVVVHNKECIIEGIIRRAILYQRQLGDYVKLFIVDLNSSDKTLEIIKRMGYPSNYFSIITMHDRQELTDFVEGYIKDDCLVMDYTNGASDKVRNITNWTTIHYLN